MTPNGRAGRKRKAEESDHDEEDSPEEATKKETATDEDAVLSKLPQSFLDFLAQNSLSPSIYVLPSTLPRYIRLAPNTTPEEVSSALQTPLTPVAYLPSFYSLPSGTRIGSSPLHKRGEIHGIDLASGVAVHALGIKGGEHVLDLCCAPGAKMAYVCDLLQQREANHHGGGSVTGVDINERRMKVCINTVSKVGGQRWRCIVQDGTIFDVYAPSRIGKECRYEPSLQPTQPNSPSVTAEDAVMSKKLKPLHATRLLRADPQHKDPSLLYDRVLVDAECTHDGSIAHFLDPTRLLELIPLQRSLLQNGYRLLKPGGILVYSTCSFARAQNEEVVAWLLRTECTATVEEIPDVGRMPVAPTLAHEFKDVDLSHVVRFSPKESRTSGLFIARIRKRASQQSEHL
ncbi:S-adenosyl-L-methionine-dependent methyltransferase [Gaertneriomyces semiglobifer]|nr:S-adenosyl-L-methionine-dependent methyltransferase [Gaertneriomyces semiglobifer]